MKNALTSVISALLLLAQCPVAVADAFVWVPMEYQQRHLWCWNASTKMLADLLGIYFDTQCELAELIRVRDGGPWGGTNCCLDPDVGCNRPAGFGAEANTLGVGTSKVFRALTFAEVQAEIDAYRPFQAWSGGHSVIVRGYLTSTPTPMLLVNDPWPYTGITLIDYSLYASSWNETNKLTGPIEKYAQLFRHVNYGDYSYTVSTGTPKLPSSWNPVPINNQASSMKVVGYPYIAYDGTNYSGAAWGVSPKDYSNYSKWYGVNDAISSMRPVPAPDWSSPAAVVLFEHENFQGSSIVVTTRVDDLTPMGWNDRVSSLVVLAGYAQVYQHSYEGGLAYAVTSDGGPNYDGFYPNPSSWGGPNDDISSLMVTNDYDSPSATTSPIVLYKGAYFSGRALLIEWLTHEPGMNGYNPRAWADYLGYQNMDDSVQSIRTRSGAWYIYADPYQQGSSAFLHAHGWFKTPAEIGLTGITSLVFGGQSWSF